MRLFTRKPAPLPCVEVVEIVTAYLEGTMPARDRARFEAHIAACEHCAAYLEQMRLTLRIEGAIPADGLSPTALSALADACAAWASEGS
jgi:anti-sigma factor RsiW